jgi:hypothetical protein
VLLTLIDTGVPILHAINERRGAGLRGTRQADAARDASDARRHRDADLGLRGGRRSASSA